MGCFPEQLCTHFYNFDQHKKLKEKKK